MEDYNDGKWHGWDGGECPVHPLSVVDYITAVDGPVRRESSYGSVEAGKLSWMPDYENWRVVAFRVVKEHREPKVWWRVGIHLHETKAEADQFLYRLRVDYPNMDFGPVVRVVEADE